MHLISGTKGQSNRQTVNGTALTTRALPKEPVDIPQAIGKRSPHIRCRLEHTAGFSDLVKYARYVINTLVLNNQQAIEFQARAYHGSNIDAKLLSRVRLKWKC